MTKEDAQRKWKKLHAMSRADTTDLWHSKEVVLLMKLWRGAQSTQLYKVSSAVQKLRKGVTGWNHMQKTHGEDMQVARSDLHLEMGAV